MTLLTSFHIHSTYTSLTTDHWIASISLDNYFVHFLSSKHVLVDSKRRKHTHYLKLLSFIFIFSPVKCYIIRFLLNGIILRTMFVHYIFILFLPKQTIKLYYVQLGKLAFWLYFLLANHVYWHAKHKEYRLTPFCLKKNLNFYNVSKNWIKDFFFFVLYDFFNT
jgi:hypothetical protein